MLAVKNLSVLLSVVFGFFRTQSSRIASFCFSEHKITDNEFHRHSKTKTILTLFFSFKIHCMRYMYLNIKLIRALIIFFLQNKRSGSRTGLR